MQTAGGAAAGFGVGEVYLPGAWDGGMRVKLVSRRGFSGLELPALSDVLSLIRKGLELPEILGN